MIELVLQCQVECLCAVATTDSSEDLLMVVSTKLRGKLLAFMLYLNGAAVVKLFFVFEKLFFVFEC